MGQSSSTPRASEAPTRRRLRRAEHRAPGNRAAPQGDRHQEEVEQALLRPSASLRRGAANRPRDGSRLTGPVASFRRQISAHSTPLRRPSDANARGPAEQDEVVYEHEERPLMSVEDIRIGDAPITHITASPMPRPPSVIARIGSRLSQRYSSIEPGTFDADEAQDRWDHALPGPPGLRLAAAERQRRRSSMFGSLAETLLPGVHSPRSRRRLAPISRPIPIDNSAQYELIGAARQAPTPDTSLARHDPAQRSRLSRVRRSISGPLEALLNSSASRNPSMRPPTPNPPHQNDPEFPAQDETEYLLPPLNIANSAINLEDRPAESANELRTRADTPIPNPSPRSSWAERLANRSPTMRRDPRRVPNLLRGRSSRIIRRDDETPLSRILQLAAATIAAQLSGGTDALPNLEPVGDDQFDGGLNNFVEELNHAAGSVQESQEGSSTAAAAATPSFNFWRVFRFVGPNSQRSAGPPEEGADPRTVTLVVVGVRSVPSSALQDGPGDGEQGLESLWDMPAMPNAGNTSRRSRSGSLLRNLGGRSRLTTRGHRSSMSDIESLAPRPGLHQAADGTRPRSTIVPQANFAQSDSQESPPGPRPPPTTPAEIWQLSPRSSSPPGLSRSESRASATGAADASMDMGSAVSDGGSTPRVSRRNTRASRRSANTAASTLASGMNHDLIPDGDNIPTIPDNVQVRQRRRSDSEQARSRNLASHRNGTIDPDGGPTQRSWLIYVVGTNLPENHPAFLTPSLFSDNPTYEDLVNLQNLIGVVKPRVADEEDVANAGGVYTISAVPGDDGSLVATSVETGEQLVIPVADACIVCLEPYAAEQQVRQLGKCSHVFHRDCVDHWLLSGCNSCPLCRGKGVEKAATQA